MTDSSQAQIRIYEESTWNETPSTGNKMTNLNITNDSLASVTTTKKSGVIRSDANVKSIGRTDVSANGSIGVELIYGEYDSLFEGALRGAFGTTFSTTGTGIAFVNSTGKITDTGNGFTNVVVGQYIHVSGATNSANNGYHKVTVKTGAGDITVATTLTDETAGASVTVKGTMCVNGTTEKSFLIEKEFSSSLYDFFTGMEVSSCAFNLALDDYINGSFDFVGKAGDRATSTQGDGSPTAASTLDSIDTISSISIFIDNVLTTDDATQFNFNISPKLRGKKALGNLGPIGIGGGQFEITGTVDFHNANNTLLDAYDGFTGKSIAVQVADAAGNAYVFDFPSVQLTSGNRNIPGQDQDIITSLGFEAELNSTISGMMGLTRIPA
jgi:hypothetical protein